MKTGLEYTIKGFVPVDFGDPAALMKASEAIASVKASAEKAGDLDEYKTKPASRRDTADDEPGATPPTQAGGSQGPKGGKAS